MTFHCGTCPQYRFCDFTALCDATATAELGYFADAPIAVDVRS